MKRTSKTLLLLFVSILTIGCGSNNIDKDVPKDPDISYSYDVNDQYENVWDSRIIHNETVVMKENDSGIICGNLLYTPKTIISIRNYGLSFEYSYSRDYYVRGNTIYRKTDSLIPYLTKENVSCKIVPDVFTFDGGSGTFPGKGGSKILFTESYGFSKYCLCVTYTHDDSWVGDKPVSKGNKLTTLKNKLAANADINMVTIGDSITYGAGASSFLKIDPQQDQIINGFSKEITRNYFCNVTSTNLSVGGTTSSQGEIVSQNLSSYNPDLVVVAYGMNDASSNTATMFYMQSIRSIIANIRNNNPNASIILIASILGSYTAIIEKFNDLLFNYEKELLALEDEYTNLAVFDMTNLSKTIADRKYSMDLYANNVNHPSDWMVRNYISGLMNFIKY